MKTILALISFYLNPDPASLEFTRIQEDWACSQMSFGAIHRSLPSIFRSLGSPRYADRQGAEVLIRFAGPFAIRPVVRATHHFSPEVRQRADRLLLAIYRCPACKPCPGTCMLCYPDYDADCVCDYLGRCLVCEGSGDVRFKRNPPDYKKNQPMQTITPRKLF